MPSVAGAWDWTKNEWGDVDRSVIETCFTQTPTVAYDASCIGEAAGLCEYTSPRHGTTFDIMQCRMAEAVVWNEIVETQFAAQWKALDIIDKNASAPGWISEADALKTAHKTWSDFRDAQCHLIYAINQGGSIKNIRAPVCMLNMTANRAFEMHELLELEQ